MVSVIQRVLRWRTNNPIISWIIITSVILIIISKWVRNLVFFAGFIYALYFFTNIIWKKKGGSNT